MNLISERWIPVRRQHGKPERIAPWELTQDIEANPIVAVASPRPDFDGALTQFLIGLLQTTCTPNTFAWLQWRKQPPSGEELRSRFESVAHAFEMEGAKAFMQDFSPDDLDKEFAISALLIGSPPEDSETDLFIKRGAINQLCPHCAATALFSLQTDSPEGGRGYRTGLRGGGPLTTLVLGNSLWETCWLNVLEQSRYSDPATENGTATDASRFPWCGPTRTSEAKPPAGITTPADVHPDQQFWSLPRRIRLLAETTEPVACDLCGQLSETIHRRFKTRNYGVNYEGFQHPLSPYYAKDSDLFAVHPQPGGIGYRHWIGIVENAPDGSKRVARVVEQYRSRPKAPEANIWAFGYDMKSNKARCWYDARMPILTIPDGMEAIFTEIAAKLINGADKAADYLREHLKEALFARAKVRGDLRFVQAEFWAQTETPFYEILRTLQSTLAADPTAYPTIEDWWHRIHDAVLIIFDQYSQTGDFDAVDPKRIADARNNLSKMLNGPALKQKILGLPKAAKTKGQTSSGSTRRVS